ncbi:methionine biosynthesis protein MetW-like protein [Candidatus Magnetobacterium bavaricum]|uniref:Methionine biosynthesis protein MetW-like protein n=1 Tax=Candidatus Magnetobacterium bavaricum TaxID=29290 RepID=A0A0F3GLZ7_9BACT|nr:methionine biosynthesis protein MetW-like protein [Candidatus Magnetobacterium bavaricum]
MSEQTALVGAEGSACWVCAGRSLELVRPSTIRHPLSEVNFAITDPNYGTTAAIYRCQGCGFLQCAQLPDVLQYYQTLKDEEYDSSGQHRLHQAEKLIQTITRYKKSGKLLDIGAGTGYLLQRAQAHGFEAVGIEPSSWLCDKAVAKGLNVLCGVLPVWSLNPPYDVVTLIDVIEHVSSPVEVLSYIAGVMSAGSVGVLVTPDVQSLAARLTGTRWWHYRVAHVGYFDRKTISLALDRAGLRPISFSRPAWYLSAAYLMSRLSVYLPSYLRLKPPAALNRLTIGFNLFDSMLVVFQRKVAGK